MRVTTIIRTVDQVCKGDAPVGFTGPASLIGVNEGRRDAFLENPFLGDGNQALQIIGHINHEVVGRLNVFPLEIVADGQVITANCGDSLYVRDEYRKTLYGVALLDKLNNVSKDRVSLSAGFSVAAQQLIRLLKNTVYPLRKFMLVRRSRAILAGFGRLHPLIYLSLFFDMGLALYNWVGKCRTRIALRGYELVEVGYDDDVAITKFCKMIADDSHRFRENITPSWVRWVLKNDFHKDWLLSKKLYGYKKRGEFVAFVMTRSTQENGYKIGKIIEWQVDERCRFLERNMIMCAMLKELRDLDYVYLSIGEIDSTGMNWRNGFLPGLGCQVISIGMGKDSPLRQHEGFDNVANWRLRGGMGDLCFS